MLFFLYISGSKILIRNIQTAIASPLEISIPHHDNDKSTSIFNVTSCAVTMPNGKNLRLSDPKDENYSDNDR